MSTRRQLVRYGMVGIASNAVLYLLYLLLTTLGMGPKLAMSLLYAVGVAQTFFLNRGWTFAHGGAVAPAGARYLVVYAGGYVFQWLSMYALVDLAGWPHRIVVAGLAVVTAGLIFMGQKLWVFSARRPAAGATTN